MRSQEAQTSHYRQAANASLRDRLTAYQLAIESLPRPAMWYMAINSRDDGSTPAGVFAVLDELRMEFQARIGDLVDDSAKNGE